MQAIPWDLVRALTWSVAIALFVIGAYSDESFQELLSWGLALVAAGLLAGDMPSLMKRMPPRS